jgi:hypothetical protein
MYPKYVLIFPYTRHKYNLGMITVYKCGQSLGETYSEALDSRYVSL